MRRRLILGVAIALVGVALGVQSFGVGAATSTTYQRTITGMDFRTLDARLGLMFVPNTGGGVYLYFLQGQNFDDHITDAEAGLSVPVGARIASATFFYKDCEDGTANTRLFF